MFKNNKSSSSGALAPAPQHLPRATAAGARGKRFPGVAVQSLLPIAGPAGAHAFRDSQVMFFGHDLPQDYYRRR